MATGNNTPELDALVAEVRASNDLGTQSCIEWLRKLLPLAAASTSVFLDKDIVKLARYLARSHRWADLQEADPVRQEYLRLLNSLLATARDPPAADGTDHHCAGLKLAGHRCNTVAKTSYTCGIPAHAKQAAATVCPGDDDSEVPTGHADNFICMGCARDSAEDHDSGSTHMSCVCCAAQFVTSCISLAEGQDIDIGADNMPTEDDMSLLCEVCLDEGRGARVASLLTSDVDDAGEPCAPRLFVVKIAAALRENITTRQARVTSRGSDPPPHQGQSAAGTTGAHRAAVPTVAEGGSSGIEQTPAQQAEVLRRLSLQVAVLQEMLTSQQRDSAARRDAPPAANRDLPHPRRADEDTGAAADRMGPVDDDALSRAYWHNQAPVSVHEFTGVKAGTDVAGRPVSNIHHYLHPHYGKYVDFLCLSTDEYSKKARSALGYVEPSGSGSIPDRHRWEDYNRAMLDYHVRMAKMDHPAFHGTTKESQNHIRQVVLVICRCRWFFGLTHGMARCGGDTTTWKDTFAMMTHVFRSEIELTDYTPFDQFFPQLVEEQLKLLQRAEAPSLSDKLQDQINAAARGRVSNYLSARGTARQDGGAPSRGASSSRQLPRERGQHAAAAPSGGMHCALCGASNHMADNHPSDRPITIPCKLCGAMHYRKTSPCEARDE